MNRKTHLVFWLEALLGLAVIVECAISWECASVLRFLVYLAFALKASTLKINLPGITGTMSANFLLILAAVVELSAPEAVLIGAASIALQGLCTPKKRSTAIQVTFNVANIAVAARLASYIFHNPIFSAGHFGFLVPALMAALVYFLAHVFPVACIVAFSEGHPLLEVWRECHFWSFPSYVAGAAVVALFHYVTAAFGWPLGLLELALTYLLYSGYHLYVDKFGVGASRTTAMTERHLKTIDALSITVDADDHNTYDRMRRMQTYAVEIGKDMGLSENELQALAVASMLHDIENLVVPERTVSRPGMTREDFAKMNVHPIIGADILERVQFPYPVVSIVRSHHERWNGKGYPDGLKYYDIPIGARILAVVDCFDSLLSAGESHKSTRFDDAAAVVSAQSGIGFDPQIVQIFLHRYEELEAIARLASVKNCLLSRQLRVDSAPCLLPVALPAATGNSSWIKRNSVSNFWSRANRLQVNRKSLAARYK